MFIWHIAILINSVNSGSVLSVFLLYGSVYFASSELVRVANMRETHSSCHLLDVNEACCDIHTQAEIFQDIDDSFAIYLNGRKIRITHAGHNNG